MKSYGQISRDAYVHATKRLQNIDTDKYAELSEDDRECEEEAAEAVRDAVMREIRLTDDHALLQAAATLYNMRGFTTASAVATARAILAEIRTPRPDKGAVDG